MESLRLSWRNPQAAGGLIQRDFSTNVFEFGPKYLIEKRAIDEMKHAEKLIARIIFLEGKPTVSKLNAINIGSDVESIHKNDHVSEVAAAKAYNEGIRLCMQAADNASRELLESILKDEEAHIDWLEAQLDQIKQMGIQNYLSEQAG